MNAKLEQPNQYIGMGIGFQRSYIQILDTMLAESGLSKDEIREIVSGFALNFAVFLDQCWHESSVGNVYPTVAFSKQHRDEQPDTYFINSGIFSFVDLVESNLLWYYEEHEGQQDSIDIGIAGEEGKGE